MFESHPLLVEPPDDQVLWRYMDLSKFLFLVETRALHFAPLTSFKDPFEGHLPRCIAEAYWRIPADLPCEQHAAHRELARLSMAKLVEGREMVSASCWHANEGESAAMWALHLKSGDGIAIRTTFGRLKEALRESEVRILGGLVNYVDYDTYERGDARINVLEWAVLKRRSFAHENEFRALHFDHERLGEGVRVSVRLESLIADVYVPSATPAWIQELVTKITVRAGIVAPLLVSGLDSAPSYLTPPADLPGT